MQYAEFFVQKSVHCIRTDVHTYPQNRHIVRAWSKGDHTESQSMLRVTDITTEEFTDADAGTTRHTGTQAGMKCSIFTLQYYALKCVVKWSKSLIRK